MQLELVKAYGDTWLSSVLHFISKLNRKEKVRW